MSRCLQASIAVLLPLVAAFPARAVTADLTIQLVMTTSFTPSNLRDDGNAVSPGYSFGTNTSNVLSVDVSDPAATGVRFEYAQGSGGWNAIGTDSTPSGTTYSVVWNLAGLASGNNYRLRAVGLDGSGADHPGVSFSGCVVNQ